MEVREKSFRIPILILLIISLIWSIMIVVSPLAINNNSIQDLSGYVGVIDNQQEIDDMDFPWDFIYGCGDRLCHQKAERSFVLNENQMPFCSRCSAIFIGISIGLAIIFFYKIELDKKFIIILLIGLVPIGIDGLGQLFDLWESNNILRVLTGGLIGVLCGVAIGIIVDELNTIRKNLKEIKK